MIPEDIDNPLSTQLMRFNDNGDVTVTDNLTGLMWTKDANIYKHHYPTKIAWLDWQHAIDYIAGLNTGSGTYGYTDWRLPSRKELRSLWEVQNRFKH
ncbi:MAG: DUF1566 domain-containing protein [Nitrospirae bacterium]|nr:DUF1566 domain-containing protein [Nitrospirota bacterium]